jgi:hypothetical protein
LLGGDVVTDESTEKQVGSAGTGKSYQVGDIGAHARVAIGENISWSEGLSRYPGGDDLTQQLSALLEQIANDQKLGEPERALATAKTQAVAAALPSAQKEPQRLQAALLDAQVFLKSTAGWAWEGLQSALTSESARTIISGITEATVKGAIQGMLGG